MANQVAGDLYRRTPGWSPARQWTDDTRRGSGVEGGASWPDSASKQRMAPLGHWPARASLLRGLRPRHQQTSAGDLRALSANLYGVRSYDMSRHAGLLDPWLADQMTKRQRRPTKRDRYNAYRPYR